MLSICIVNWNTKTYLRECLASIDAFPPVHEPVEVIVVDNASTDNSAQMVSVEFPHVKLIANYHNASYAAGNNQALAAASGDRLLLLNPDVLLQAGSLTAALAFLDAHPDAGVVGVRQILSDGTTQPSVRGFPDPSAIAWDVFGLSRVLPKSRRFGAYRRTFHDYNAASEVDQPMGTFLLTRREVYDAVGGMDEAFPLFFNDVDWCYRVRQAGWKIYYTPDAEIVHYGGSGTKQAPKPATIRESHRSMIRFYEKHYKTTIPKPVFALIKAAIVAGEYARILAATKRLPLEPQRVVVNPARLLPPPPPAE